MTDKLDKGPAGSSAGGPPAATVAKSSVPPEAIRAIPVRHYGRWVSAVIVLGLLGLLFNAFSQGDIRWVTVGDYLFDDRVLKGAGRTLLISVLSMLIGLVLGLLFAVMRRSKNPVTSGVAWLYIWFFRGTPVLVQLLIWFNLALVFQVLNLGPFYKDEMTDVMTPFVVALLGLGLNEGAYMAEIVRAGIQSVDEGQTEAAHALGMKNTTTTRRIILPQAMRVIVPPTGNEFINLLKTSSLVTVVSYVDLLRAAQSIGSTSFAVFELLLVASVWYLVLTSVFSVGQYYLERHYAKGSQRSLPLTPLQRLKKNLAPFSNRSSRGGIA